MEPLSLEQISAVLAAKKKPTQFFQYKDLPSEPEKLASLLLRYPPRFLFYTANKSSNTGHWTALRRLANHIFWFSSYGFLPDGEIMVSSDMREVPGQESYKISKALEYLRQKNFVIHYSCVPLQSLDDGTVSCGIWVLMFLTACINDFEEFEARLAAITDPEAYANAIYRYEILGEQRKEEPQSFNNSMRKPSFSSKPHVSTHETKKVFK